MWHSVLLTTAMPNSAGLKKYRQSTSAANWQNGHTYSCTGTLLLCATPHIHFLKASANSPGLWTSINTNHRTRIQDILQAARKDGNKHRGKGKDRREKPRSAAVPSAQCPIFTLKSKDKLHLLEVILQRNVKVESVPPVCEANANERTSACEKEQFQNTCSLWRLLPIISHELLKPARR